MKANTIKEKLNRLFLYSSIMMLLLSPYTIIGRPDVVLALFFSLYAVISLWVHMPRSIARDQALLFVLIIIGFYGSLISNFFVTPQTHHARVMLSLMVVYTSFLGAAVFAKKNLRGTINIRSIVVGVGLLNSCIVIVEFLKPEVRGFVEGLLVQFNLSYAVGFKYRGIASAGGAGLSVFQAMIFLIICHEIQRKNISVLFGVFALSIVFLSTLLIGRTGVIFMIATCVYFAARSLLLLLSFATAAFVTVAYYDEFSIFLWHKEYQFDVLSYSLGFIFQENGFAKEGTIGILLDYWFLPSSANLIYGYGFYGIGPFEPWTDSGYIRSILSVGLPLAIVKYVILYWIFLRRCWGEPLLMGLLLILAIAEIKEPFLVSGFGNRLLLCMMIFFFMEKSNESEKPLLSNSWSRFSAR